MIHFFHNDVDRVLQIGPTHTDLPFGYERENINTNGSSWDALINKTQRQSKSSSIPTRLQHANQYTANKRAKPNFEHPSESDDDTQNNERLPYQKLLGANQFIYPPGTAARTLREDKIPDWKPNTLKLVSNGVREFYNDLAAAIASLSILLRPWSDLTNDGPHTLLDINDSNCPQFNTVVTLISKMIFRLLWDHRTTIFSDYPHAQSLMHAFRENYEGLDYLYQLIQNSHPMLRDQGQPANSTSDLLIPTFITQLTIYEFSAAMIRFIANNKSYSRHPPKTLTTYFLDQLETDGRFTSGVDHIRNLLTTNYKTGTWLPPFLCVDGQLVHTIMGRYNESDQNELALAKEPLVARRFQDYRRQPDKDYKPRDKDYKPRDNGNHSRDKKDDKTKLLGVKKCPACGRNHDLKDCRDTGKYLSITEFLTRISSKERNDILRSFKANQKEFLDRIKDTKSRRDSARQRIQKFKNGNNDERKARTFAIDYELSQDHDLTFCTFDKRFDLEHEIELTFEDLDTLHDFDISEDPEKE